MIRFVLLLLGTEINACGATCMLTIAAAGLFLLGAIAMVVACCRLEKVKKAVREKFSQDTLDLSAPLSDYVDRGVLLDNLQLSFDMTRTLQNSDNKCLVSNICTIKCFRYWYNALIKTVLCMYYSIYKVTEQGWFSSENFAALPWTYQPQHIYQL